MAENESGDTSERYEFDAPSHVVDFKELVNAETDDKWFGKCPLHILKDTLLGIQQVGIVMEGYKSGSNRQRSLFEEGFLVTCFTKTCVRHSYHFPVSFILGCWLTVLTKVSTRRSYCHLKVF